LEERSNHGELGCFLRVEDRNDLEEEFLADGAAGDEFSLFWETMAELEM